MMGPPMPELSRRTQPWRLTQRTPLPGAGDVSPFCVGMVDDPETIVAAFDAGINFFFLSGDLHWGMYEATRVGLARLLARGGIRERIVVGVVSYVTQPEFIPAAYEEAVASVPGLGRADVLIAGGCYAHDFFVRLGTLEQLRASRWLDACAIGASFHDRDAARLAIQRGLIDVAFVRYNAAHTGALNDLFPHLPRPRLSLVYNFSSTKGYVAAETLDRLGLGPDYWRPRVTDHYRMVAARAELDGVLCSPRTPDMVRALVDAMAQAPLSEEEEHYLHHLVLLASGRAQIDEG